MSVPIDQLAFPAYRLPVGEPGGAYSPPAVFLSLAHWFEAEKFRAFHRDLFDEVMLSPTVREARRIAKRYEKQWRGDWLGVRLRALACGMVYAAGADTDTSRWLGSAEDVARAMAPLGLPERFLLGASSEFVRLRDAQRYTFLGAAAAPPEHVGRKVNLLHKRSERAWTFAHWSGRHGSWRVHDWAVAQFVPIMYLGLDAARLGSKAIEALRESGATAIVFERRKGKSMDAPLRALRLAKVPVELDLYADAESGLV